MKEISATGILSTIGNTPLITIELKNKMAFYAKLECANPFGSMKDRAASFAIRRAIEAGLLKPGGTVIESSSGNLAIALASVCQLYGLHFICFVDPQLSAINRQILINLGAELVVATKKDENGCYIKHRMQLVADYSAVHNDAYWVNQYDNTYIRQSYYQLADEILLQLPQVQSILIPVGTCGTIAGISRIIKEKKPSCKIVAVDVEGSCIFSSSTVRRLIPGMGTSIVPGNLKSATIDELIYVSELECIRGCRELAQMSLFVGASSGGVISALHKRYPNAKLADNIIAIFPDRGERYLDTVYSSDWCQSNYCKLNSI